MKSITLKEFERRTDGVLESPDPDEPIYIMEFQAQNESKIYHRIAMEMASYAMEHDSRDVRGILIFLHKKFDPQTTPWHYLTKSKDKLLIIVYLDEYINKLEKSHPNHPMVLVFKPLLVKDIKILSQHSRQWYQNIKKSRLPKNVKDNFTSTFFRWLSARFPDLSGEEITKMIEIENLPNFEETRAYKDLFSMAEKIGEKRGKKIGEKCGEEARLIKEIKRLKKMHKKGDIDEIVFHKICEPIQKDLQKIKQEISEMIKRQQKR
jgi:hypothetical protein